MSAQDVLFRLRAQGGAAVQSEFRKVIGGAEKLEKSADRTGRAWDRAGKLIGGAAGLAALGAVGKQAVETASDIDESLSKNKQLFGGSATEVEQFARTSATSFGISRAAALEYTGVFGNLARGMGVGEQAAAAQSTAMVRLAADLASFNNTSVDEALEALRSGLVGESEPLRKFGVNLNAAAVEAEALSAGIVKPVKDMSAVRAAQVAQEKAMLKGAEAVKKYGRDSVQAREAVVQIESAEKKLEKAMKGQKVELTDRQKAQAIVSLTMKQTAAAQGDFARTSEGLANKQKVLKAQFSDASGALGTLLLPALTDAANAASRFIEEMRSGEGAGGRFVDALEDIHDAVAPVVRFFERHPEFIGIAVAAWATYKTAAATALAIDKLQTARKVFGGMGGTAAVEGRKAGRSYGRAFGIAAAGLMAYEVAKSIPALAQYSGSDGWRELQHDVTGDGANEFIRNMASRLRVEAATKAGQQGTAGPRIPSNKKARGGTMMPGRYLVGEEGPEVFETDSPGFMRTAGQSRMMGGDASMRELISAVENCTRAIYATRLQVTGALLTEAVMEQRAFEEALR